MSNPLLSLNENFSYNSMLARALLQLMPAKDKIHIDKWLQILHLMHESVDEMTIRNEYMWFLLLQLQNKRITEPFNKIPTSIKLPPLRELLPPHIYEEVLTSTEQNQSWLENIEAEGGGGGGGGQGSKGGSVKTKKRAAPPASFLSMQPIPNKGIICYMAAFSEEI